MVGECSSVLQVQVPAGYLGGAIPSSRHAQRQRHAALVQLQLPDVRRLRDGRVPRMLQEEARQQRRERSLAGQDLPGRRPALVVQAWQPCRHVEQRRSDTGPVPIDEDGSLADQTEVVAADVAVQEGVALEQRLAGGLRQGPSPGREPGIIEQAERQCARGVCAKRQPSLLDVEHLAEEGLDLLGRRRRLHRRQRLEHGVDACGRPRRRPMGAREVLDHERRCLSVVVPPQQSGQVVVSGEDLVVGSLEPEPVGGVVERGDLSEGGRPVVEGDQPAAIGWRAVPGGRHQGGRPLPAGGLDATSVVRLVVWLVHWLVHSRHLRTRARASLGR